MKRRDEDLSRYIGSALRSARNKAGMTQEQVAASLDTSQSYLSAVESGDRTPSAPTMFNLANAYGTSVGDFFPTENQLDTAADMLRGEGKD